MDYPASFLHGIRWHYLLRLAVALLVELQRNTKGQGDTIWSGLPCPFMPWKGQITGTASAMLL